MTTPKQLAAAGTEGAHQSALFCWVALERHKRLSWPCPENNRVAAALELLHAIPNGDQRGDGTKKGAQIAGNRLKREGLREGVPDTSMPYPVFIYVEGVRDPMGTRYHGLYIEMKRPDLKRANDPLHGCKPEQKDWIARLRNVGYRVEVCYTWEEARDVILSYLNAA